MLLICYDGSPDAQAAIEQAGLLMPRQPATVLTVWEPILDLMARTGGIALWPDGVEMEQIDHRAERAARERAEEGASRAERVGLNPVAHTRIRDTTIARTILGEADRIGAEAIVMGTRGLTGVRSMLGSVSHA